MDPDTVELWLWILSAVVFGVLVGLLGPSIPPDLSGRLETLERRLRDVEQRFERLLVGGEDHNREP